MPTLNVIFSLKYWLKKTHFLIFSDRILEAEKICDKHEMEQFPNDADDIQVGEIHDIHFILYRLYGLGLYMIYTDDIKVSEKNIQMLGIDLHLRMQPTLYIKQITFNKFSFRPNSNSLPSASLPHWLSGPSTSLTSLNSHWRTRSFDELIIIN